MNLHTMFSPQTRRLITVAIPIILSSILQLTYDLTDMIWVGRLGSEEVAAVGTASFFIKLGWSIASIITMGAMVLVSHSVGSKEQSKLEYYVATAIKSTLVLGVIYSLITFLFPEYLIDFFEIDNERVNHMAESYLRISSIGITLSFINLLFGSIYNAHSKTKTTFHAMLWGNIVNIILDPVLILVLKWGVEGAAWATIIAKVGVTLYFFYINHKEKTFAIRWDSFSWGYLKEIIRIGSGTAIQRILFTVIAIAVGRIVSSWGADAIAAQKLGLQVEALSFMLMGGLMQSTAILVGQSYGTKDYQQINMVYKSGLKMAMFIGGSTSILFILFPEILVSIFVNDPQTIEVGAAYLQIVGISQLFGAMEMLTSGVYTGLGMTKYPATVSIVFTAMRIPLALFLGYKTSLGIDGVWWSISITSILKGLTLYYLYTRTRKTQAINQQVNTVS